MEKEAAKRRGEVIVLNRRHRELLDEITHLRQREVKIQRKPSPYLSEKISNLVDRVSSVDNELKPFRCSVNEMVWSKQIEARKNLHGFLDEEMNMEIRENKRIWSKSEYTLHHSNVHHYRS